MRTNVLVTILGVVGAAILTMTLLRGVSKQRDLGLKLNPAIAAFNNWAAKQNKLYKSPEELNYRRGVFVKNYYKVLDLNRKHSHKSALNKFSDLTEEEFVAKYTGYRVSNSMRTNVIAPKAIARPDSVDWRQQGAVNAMKDQGQCGSCWAFSATSAIESIWKISGKGSLLNLAEQQMVDCGGSTGNYGCNGGWMDWAFQYIINVGGQEATADYPYTAMDGQCAFDASKIKATIKGYSDIPANNCEALLDAIAQQPVSVAIAANAIMFYDSGVFSSTTCGTSINHGVTAVGYGTDASVKKDYYLVRNSWGSGWGEQGYIRFDRQVQTSTGICAICSVASYPTV